MKCLFFRVWVEHSVDVFDGYLHLILILIFCFYFFSFFHSFNIIKTTYDKHTANIIVNREKLERIPLLIILLFHDWERAVIFQPLHLLIIVWDCVLFTDFYLPFPSSKPGLLQFHGLFFFIHRYSMLTYICIDIYFTNISCYICKMLLKCMFSGLTIWDHCRQLQSINMQSYGVQSQEMHLQSCRHASG